MKSEIIVRLNAPEAINLCRSVETQMVADRKRLDFWESITESDKIGTVSEMKSYFGQRIKTLLSIEDKLRNEMEGKESDMDEKFDINECDDPDYYELQEMYRKEQIEFEREQEKLHGRKTHMGESKMRAMMNENKDEQMTVDDMWDELSDLGVSEQTLQIVTRINGYNKTTMTDILYAYSGYRSFEQFDDEFPTLNDE